MNQARLAQQLRGLRQNRGKTVRQVAEECGYSFQYVNALENNDDKANPTIGALERIAESVGGRLVVSVAPAGAPEQEASALDALEPDRRARVLQFAELAARASADLLDGVILALEARTSDR